MELDFDKIFRASFWALKINRSHPSIVRNKKWIVQVIFIQVLYLMDFMFFINSIKYDFKRGDFSSTCRNLCLCTVYLAITCQYFTMLVYRETIIKLIDIIKEDYKKNQRLIENSEVVVLYAKKGAWVINLWVVTSAFGFWLFPAKNIILYIAQYYRGDEFKLIPFYELTYPDIIEDNKNNIIIYLVTYACLTFYAAYSSTIYLGFVPLGPIFMLHACGQLELIKRRIHKLFDGSLSAREINVELMDIIRRLQLIYSFVDDVKRIVKFVYELVLKTNAIKMPVTLYLVIQSFHEGEIRIEFLVFILGGVAMSATPCYYSDVLMSKSEEIRQAIYTCGWERQYDRSTRSMILILLIRAIRPIAIRTMFRTICLEALTDLYQQSYTIFSLMNAMWN